MKTKIGIFVLSVLSLAPLSTRNAQAIDETMAQRTLTLRAPVRLAAGDDWFAVSEGRFLTSGRGIDASRTAPHRLLSNGARACVIMLNAPTPYLEAGVSAKGSNIETKSGSFLGIRIDTSYLGLDGGGLKFLVCYRKEGNIATASIGLADIQATLAGSSGYIDLR